MLSRHTTMSRGVNARNRSIMLYSGRSAGLWGLGSTYSNGRMAHAGGRFRRRSRVPIDPMVLSTWSMRFPVKRTAPLPPRQSRGAPDSLAFMSAGDAPATGARPVRAARRQSHDAPGATTPLLRSDRREQRSRMAVAAPSVPIVGSWLGSWERRVNSSLGAHLAGRGSARRVLCRRSARCVASSSLQRKVTEPHAIVVGTLYNVEVLMAGLGRSYCNVVTGGPSIR